MGKHAYLIMAHNEFELLKTQLGLIDDYRNDIFIHIDKKVNSFSETDITKSVTKSNIYFIDRINVTWGSISQIECELKLLKNSIKGDYDYYHLISGQDLPIKSQNYIHHFFDSNNGKEFIRFQSDKFNFYERVKYYYYFIDLIGNSKTLKSKLIRNIEKCSILMQKLFKINRIKNTDLIYQKGTNWFSITNDFAKYVVSKSDEVLNSYKHTYCCDEIFLQTLLINSPFVKNLYNVNLDNSISSIMRLIDWERGKPYTFTLEDYEEIINSNMLFARKFSMKKDRDIIYKLRDYIKNNEQLI